MSSEMFTEINGEPYVSTAGIILMTLNAILDPDVPKDGKQRAQMALEEFIKVAKLKGHKDIEKILFRGVIDEFTINKAKEIGASITTEEFVQALNNVGFNISGVKRIDHD